MIKSILGRVTALFFFSVQAEKVNSKIAVYIKLKFIFIRFIFGKFETDQN